MLGSEYNWLLSPARTARGLTVRLARHSFLTLGVGAFCLTCVLSSASLAAPAPAVATPNAAVLAETAQSELPRALIRLWVFVPYLLPQR